MPGKRRSGDLGQSPLAGRDFRRLIDAQLGERQWQQQVERALRRLGWWFYHPPVNVIVCSRCGHRNYRGVEKGLPDLIAMRKPYKLWLELKTEVGQLKPEQRQVLELVRECPQDLVLREMRPRHREQLFDLLAHPEG